jgi:hypothetical protein
VRVIQAQKIYGGAVYGGTVSDGVDSRTVALFHHLWSLGVTCNSFATLQIRRAVKHCGFCDK